MLSKGITVTYHDKQYKKKVLLSVNSTAVLDGDESNKSNSDKLVRKLEKRVGDYFNSKYALDDFALSKMCLVTDIDVRSREKTADYIKVLKRVGRVKGFSPLNSEYSDEISFCLEGNSNATEFWIYDLERLLMEQSSEIESDGRELKKLAKKCEGLLRAEVKLTKPKAVREYTDETITSAQIADLSGKGQKIFLDTFTRVVPFGGFYKKERAIRERVSDMKIRRRMLRLQTPLKQP
jgi:hypothetical protein